MKTFITSDLHFNHNKPFLYEPRGFKSIEEHDKSIINNWNSIVSEEDTVFMLGDFAMSTDFDYVCDCINRLNGKIYWIIGNHDTENKLKEIEYNCKNVIAIGYATIEKFGKWRFYLSHFPTVVGNYDDEEKHTKFYCLCGHTHTKEKFKDFDKKCYHCELDAHNNFPVNIEDIIEDIKTKND